MNNWEAVRLAVQEGRKIRHKKWPEDCFRAWNSHRKVWEDYQGASKIPLRDDADEGGWELYEQNEKSVQDLNDMLFSSEMSQSSINTQIYYCLEHINSKLRKMECF